MIFDTHAHYDDEQFEIDRNQILNSLRENGIEYIVNVGASIKSSKQTLSLMEQYPFVYGAIGVHPSETKELNEETFAWLKEATNNKKVVAIGEIGLDYYWKEPEPDIQRTWFIRQLQLAKELNLPVIIHSRDAAKETYDIMKEQKAEEIGGVIHCFSYSLEMAEKFLDMGFYLGIGGVVTFNNAKKLKEVVTQVPIEKLVLETDCPYLAPVPNRGKRNSSLNLCYVVEEIARLKEISEEEVIMKTRENAKKLYRLNV